MSCCAAGVRFFGMQERSPSCGRILEGSTQETSGAPTYVVVVLESGAAVDSFEHTPRKQHLAENTFASGKIKREDFDGIRGVVAQWLTGKCRGGGERNLALAVEVFGENNAARKTR